MAETTEHVPRKMVVARSILHEARRMNVREMLESMWMLDGNGRIVVEGEPLPGFTGEDISCEEIAAVATAAADFELWWIRAAGKQAGITVGYMDWLYYNDEVYGQVAAGEYNQD